MKKPFDVVSKTEELSKSLVTLQKTKTIQEEDLSLPKWFFLRTQYDRVMAHCPNDVEAKTIISLWNAILFQERIILVVTRDNLRDLVKNDANWKGKYGVKKAWRNDKYSSILNKLTPDDTDPESGGLLKELYKHEGGPSVYEVIDETTLKLLSPNRENQLKQAQDFILSKYPKSSINLIPSENGDRIGDQGGDQAVRSKELEERSKKLAVSSEESVVRTKDDEESLKPASPSGSALSSTSGDNAKGPIGPRTKKEDHDLLYECLALPGADQKEFLKDKEAKLKLHGCFTANQRKILQEIKKELQDACSPSTHAEGSVSGAKNNISIQKEENQFRSINKPKHIIPGKVRDCRNCGKEYTQYSGFQGACSETCYNERRSPLPKAEPSITALNNKAWQLSLELKDSGISRPKPITDKLMEISEIEDKDLVRFRMDKDGSIRKGLLEVIAAFEELLTMEDTTEIREVSEEVQSRR